MPVGVCTPREGLDALEKGLKSLRRSRMMTLNEFKAMYGAIERHHHDLKLAHLTGKTKDLMDKAERDTRFYHILVQMLSEVKEVKSGKQQESLKKVYTWYLANKHVLYSGPHFGRIYQREAAQEVLKKATSPRNPPPSRDSQHTRSGRSRSASQRQTKVTNGLSTNHSLPDKQPDTTSPQSPVAHSNQDGDFSDTEMDLELARSPLNNNDGLDENMDGHHSRGVHDFNCVTPSVRITPLREHSTNIPHTHAGLPKRMIHSVASMVNPHAHHSLTLNPEDEEDRHGVSRMSHRPTTAPALHEDILQSWKNFNTEMAYTQDVVSKLEFVGRSGTLCDVRYTAHEHGEMPELHTKQQLQGVQPEVAGRDENKLLQQTLEEFYQTTDAYYPTSLPKYRSTRHRPSQCNKPKSAPAPHTRKSSSPPQLGRHFLQQDREPEVESGTNVKFNMVVNLVDAVSGNMSAHKERVAPRPQPGFRQPSATGIPSTPAVSRPATSRSGKRQSRQHSPSARTNTPVSRSPESQSLSEVKGLLIDEPKLEEPAESGLPSRSVSAIDWRGKITPNSVRYKWGRTRFGGHTYMKTLQRPGSMRSASVSSARSRPKTAPMPARQKVKANNQTVAATPRDASSRVAQAASHNTGSVDQQALDSMMVIQHLLGSSDTPRGSMGSLFNFDDRQSLYHESAPYSMDPGFQTPVIHSLASPARVQAKFEMSASASLFLCLAEPVSTSQCSRWSLVVARRIPKPSVSPSGSPGESGSCLVSLVVACHEPVSLLEGGSLLEWLGSQSLPAASPVCLASLASLCCIPRVRVQCGGVSQPKESGGEAGGRASSFWRVKPARCLATGALESECCAATALSGEPVPWLASQCCSLAEPVPQPAESALAANRGPNYSSQTQRTDYPSLDNSLITDTDIGLLTDQLYSTDQSTQFSGHHRPRTLSGQIHLPQASESVSSGAEVDHADISELEDELRDLCEQESHSGEITQDGHTTHVEADKITDAVTKTEPEDNSQLPAESPTIPEPLDTVAKGEEDQDVQVEVTSIPAAGSGPVPPHQRQAPLQRRATIGPDVKHDLRLRTAGARYRVTSEHFTGATFTPEADPDLTSSKMSTKVERSAGRMPRQSGAKPGQVVRTTRRQTELFKRAPPMRTPPSIPTPFNPYGGRSPRGHQVFNKELESHARKARSPRHYMEHVRDLRSVPPRSAPPVLSTAPESQLGETLHVCRLPTREKTLPTTTDDEFAGHPPISKMSDAGFSQEMSDVEKQVKFGDPTESVGEEDGGETGDVEGPQGRQQPAATDSGPPTPLPRQPSLAHIGRPIAHYQHVPDPEELSYAVQVQKEAKAAVDIQRIFRGYVARGFYKKLLSEERWCQEDKQRAKLNSRRMHREHVERTQAIYNRGRDPEDLAWQKEYKAIRDQQGRVRQNKLDSVSRENAYNYHVSASTISVIGPHVDIYQVYHPKKTGPTQRELNQFALTIQKTVRGWLIRRRLEKLRRKATWSGFSFERMVKDYKTMLARVQRQHGRDRPKTPFTFKEMNEYMDLRRRYESVFEKKAFGGELELCELDQFFKECDLYPSQAELDEAVDVLFKGKGLRGRGLRKNEVLDVVFYVYVPKAAGVRGTRMSTWMSPIIDGVEARRLIGRCGQEADWQLGPGDRLVGVARRLIGTEFVEPAPLEVCAKLVITSKRERRERENRALLEQQGEGQGEEEDSSDDSEEGERRRQMKAKLKTVNIVDRKGKMCDSRSHLANATFLVIQYGLLAVCKRSSSTPDLCHDFPAVCTVNGHPTPQIYVMTFLLSVQ
ncbi:LOW QUALITY PROTEIN: uncharacterized protein LOC124269070 [Haliotis rubra]|uniref:LOW QUALITY PROTEIN: uncharacterized protein LOC124269070 n=1 Tax=Haliotis rubra TaxID=36100 RepID=UPI001EE6308C|nr:LOW QUALITY PROTEIN: uncharacterized protein LOC124269070 [Haliotis rubra]